MDNEKRVVLSLDEQGRQIVLLNLHVLAKLTEACIDFTEIEHVKFMLAKVKRGLFDLGEMIDDRDVLEELHLS